jgi:hypothetical protein
LGLIVVDSPVEGGLSRRDLSLVSLFAKLYGLVLTDDIAVGRRTGVGEVEVRNV